VAKVVDLVDLAGYEEVPVLAKEQREDWAEVVDLVLKEQVVEEHELLV
jgi:aspartate ammonia-lyase